MPKLNDQHTAFDLLMFELFFFFKLFSAKCHSVSRGRGVKKLALSGAVDFTVLSLTAFDVYWPRASYGRVVLGGAWRDRRRRRRRIERSRAFTRVRAEAECRENVLCRRPDCTKSYAVFFVSFLYTAVQDVLRSSEFIALRSSSLRFFTSVYYTDI